jgi:hypothetical protein
MAREVLFCFANYSPKREKYLLHTPEMMPDIGNWTMAWGVGFPFRDSEQGYFIYNLGDPLEAAKKADVLFIGNSKIQFAMDSDLLSATLSKYNNSFFMLGFGDNEGSKIYDYFFRRHVFKNKLIIIHGEAFFNRDGSIPTNDALNPSRDHITFHRKIEIWYKYFIYRYILKHFPVFVGYDKAVLNPNAKNAVYRNNLNGDWNFSKNFGNRFEGDDVRAIEAEKIEPGEDSLDIAREFKELTAKNGSKILIVSIPSNKKFQSDWTVKKIAEHIKVPYLNLDIKGLVTFDGIHLNEKSSKLVTRKLLEQMEEGDFLEKNPN